MTDPLILLALYQSKIFSTAILSSSFLASLITYFKLKTVISNLLGQSQSSAEFTQCPSEILRMEGVPFQPVKR